MSTTRLEVLRSAYRSVMDAESELNLLMSKDASTADVEEAEAKLMSAQSTYDEIRYSNG